MTDSKSGRSNTDEATVTMKRHVQENFFQLSLLMDTPGSLKSLNKLIKEDQKKKRNTFDPQDMKGDENG